MIKRDKLLFVPIWHITQVSKANGGVFLRDIMRSIFQYLFSIIGRTRSSRRQPLQYDRHHRAFHSSTLAVAIRMFMNAFAESYTVAVSACMY